MTNKSIAVIGSGPVGTLFSNLLQLYGVKHLIVDKSFKPTSHPQAHYINARSLEILRCWFPFQFKLVLDKVPNSLVWRDFAYCHSVAEQSLARVDNFATTSDKFWQSTPTNVIHIVQSKFERVLREFSESQKYYGYELIGLRSDHSNGQVIIKSQNDTKNIPYDLVFAADGANSFVRNSLGIALNGKNSLQSLINVHFTCKNLRKHLSDKPAMLYFVFNENIVGVFVCHDPTEDEWVCQIPYFPPYQTPQDFDHDKVMQLIKAGIGEVFSNNSNKSNNNSAVTTSSNTPNTASPLDITIHSIKHWIMNAQVASSYHNKHQNIFLLGDAAHRFPPAGGLGMNTGLHDVLNMAWKVAWVIHGWANKSLLSTYEQERQPIATHNTVKSLKNYHKSEEIARTLGVDPQLAQFTVSTLNSSEKFVPFMLRKQIFHKAMTTGLYHLKWLKYDSNHISTNIRINALQKLLHNGEHLPLIYPEEDLFYCYKSGALLNDNDNRNKIGRNESIDNNTNSNNDNNTTEQRYNEPVMNVGMRIPHCWLEIILPSKCNVNNDSNNNSNRRQFVSTIEIPSIAWKLQQLNRTSNSNIDNTKRPPTAVIVVDELYKSYWIDALLQWYTSAPPIFTLVTVKSTNSNRTSESTQSASSASSLVSHEEIQYQLQTPRYSNEYDVKSYYHNAINRNIEPNCNHNIDIFATTTTPTDRSSSDTTHQYSSFNYHIHQKATESSSNKQELASVMEEIVSNKYRNCNNNEFTRINCLQLVDTTGKWNEKCNEISQYNHHDKENSNTSLLSIIIRPDGHVAAINSDLYLSNSQRMSKEEREDEFRSKIIQFLNDVAQCLHVHKN